MNFILSIFRYFVRRKAYKALNGAINLPDSDKRKAGNGCLSIIIFLALVFFAFYWSSLYGRVAGIGFAVSAAMLYGALGAFYSSTIKTYVVYEKQPVIRRDRRYKSGERIEYYKDVAAGREPLTEEEIAQNKAYHLPRAKIFSILFILSLGISIAFLIPKHSANTHPVKADSVIVKQDTPAVKTQKHHNKHKHK